MARETSGPVEVVHEPDKAAVVEGDETLAGHWLIVQPPRETERWFSPPISRAKLANLYPGAALVPIQPTAATQPTSEQKAELTRLVGLVAAAEGFSESELAEALDRALRDPEHALVSFRALARGKGIIEERAGDSVRLWLSATTEDGDQQIALDIPRGKFDGVRILDLLEKHLAAGTTRGRCVTDLAS